MGARELRPSESEGHGTASNAETELVGDDRAGEAGTGGSDTSGASEQGEHFRDEADRLAHHNRRSATDDETEATEDAGGRAVGRAPDGAPLVEGPNPA